MVRYSGRSTTGTIHLLLIAAAAAAVLFASCGKDTQDAEESRSTETSAVPGPGEITSFRLDNGVTVYLREDRSQPELAVLALHRAGVIHESEGKVHISRVLPHVLIFSPTASFQAGEAVELVSGLGRINGEVLGEFSRFDYSAPSDQLELLLKIEAERFTSVVITEEQLEKYAQKCADDIDRVLESPNLSMSKYGLMALNQAHNYGITSIPIYSGVHDLTVDDLEQFHTARYRLTDMVLVVVGDFETDTATDLIKKHFGSVEQEPRKTVSPRPAKGDITAYWDVASTVMFLVYPGPYQGEAERLVLTMFGTFLRSQLGTDAELGKQVLSSFCSNTINPVGDIPFFVFVEVKKVRPPRDIRPEILMFVGESAQNLDAKMFDRMKSNLINYFRSSVLESQRTISSIKHQKALEQEALNIGTRHFLRNGRTTEEIIEMIQSITYDDARRYLDSRLTPENMRTISIQER